MKRVIVYIVFGITTCLFWLTEWSFESNAASSNPPSNKERFLQVVAEGDVRQVAKLLNTGIDPNIRNCDGVPPLHTAAYHGMTGLVKLLIANGADVNIQVTEKSIIRASSLGNQNKMGSDLESRICLAS